MKELDHLLSRQLQTVPLYTTLAEATATMRQYQLSSLLVVDANSTPQGIITERDILHALAHETESATVIEQVMSKPVISAPANTEFRDGYHLLAFHNIRHLLITDDNGAPKGIVSESDFRNHLSSNFISRLRDIRGVMSTSALTVPESSRLGEAIQTMSNQRCTCVVATRNRLPCGILTEFDAVKLYNNPEINADTPVREVMIKPVRTIPENTPVPAALELMQTNNIRHLVVVDRRNEVVGLVTEHDIVHQIEIEFAGEMQRLRRITESELKRYEHKLHAIFDTTNIFLALLNPSGSILEINAAALKVSGMERDDVLLRPIWDTVWRSHDHHHTLRLQETIREVQAGHTRRLDTEHLDANKRSRYCDCRFQPIMGENDQVDYILVEGLDITDLRSSQQKLKQMAFYDPLTNLPNRTLLGERMQDALLQGHDDGRVLAIGYLDLDHFKPVNDELGHDYGDQLLIEVANRLRNVSRQEDTVARLGGDEFVLLLPYLTDRQQAEDTFKRILEHIAAPYMLSGVEVQLSASLGITLYPDDDSNPDKLLRHADQAMYKAKQRGRNQYYLFNSAESNADDGRQRMIRQAWQSLRLDQFELYYQPKVDMKTGVVIGAEALIRWHHPVQGLLLPGQFLPQLQGDPVMIKLEEWILANGIRQLSLWHLQGLELSLNLNVSGQLLQEPTFVAMLLELLESHPYLPSCHIELEILENTALENIANAGEVIEQCRALGVGVALDDFGTGYSSLTHLKRLPADSIKIDCSFVADLIDDPEDLAIVEGILGLARAFRLKTVAEGVEGIEQGIMLLNLGCRIAQGFAIAHPMPARVFPDWIKSYQPPMAWQETVAGGMPLQNFPLLAASVDHRNWVSRIIEYVNLNQRDDHPKHVGDHINCRFGGWLNGDGRSRFGHTERWLEVDQLHKAIHVQSAKMVRLTRESSHAEAQLMIPSLLEKRDQLLEHLRQWYADELQPV